MKKVFGVRKRRIKNRKDTRYLEVQERLDAEIGRSLRVGYIARLNVLEISRKAKVWKSTFYNHFFHLDDALNHFNHKKRPALKKLAKESCESGCDLEVIFTKILYFIYTNRAYYKIALCSHDLVSFLDIPDSFHNLFIRFWSNYDKETNERNFVVFSWELCGLIYYWGKKKRFDKAEITKYAKYLTRLTQNASRRLTSI